MVVIRMKYVRRVKSKGRVYWYYRRDGVNLAKLPELTAPNFLAEYNQAHLAYENNIPASRILNAATGTVRELVEKYLASPNYLALADSSRKSYRRYADLLNRLLGDERRDDIRQSTILGLRDAMADTPGKANEFVKVVRVIFGWGMPRDMVTTNPADFRMTDVKPLALSEHQPWPEPLIERFLNEADNEVAWVIVGLLFTGQRIGDTLNMSWGNVGNGKINIIQQKTGKQLAIPIHIELQSVLDIIPKRSTRIFTSLTGRVWSYDNWRHQWDKNRKRLEAVGYVPHGLRKNAVIRLRQAGCSIEQTGAITGQSDEMVKYYSRHMEQEKLAEVGMQKYEAWSQNQK